MKRLLNAVVLMSLGLLCATGALAAPKTTRPAKQPPAPPTPQELVLRHTLSGDALGALATLVVRFNDNEAKGKKDIGRILLEDSQSVMDKARLPHLAIFDQDDAVAVFDGRPRFLPLNKVMETSGQRFDTKQFYPQMSDAVNDLAGKMQALPLGMSLPVLFYSKEVFSKAKLDPNNPPQTWWQLQEVAGVLRDAGWKCPLTSSRFSWVHLENVASQHGEPMVVKNGKQDQLALNNMVNVKHMSLLTSWYKSNYFIYSGPGREGDEKFANGECAMLTGESALYARLKKTMPNPDVGITLLPHYDDVYGARPTHVLPDGLALWVLAADNKPERQVIGRFINFLLQPDVQREWVRTTGYLPMTPVAVQVLRETGGNPVLLDQTEKRLSMTTREAARTRNEGGGRSRIRAILDEEVAFVWGNLKPPKEALDTAVMRAGAVLAPVPVSKK